MTSAHVCSVLAADNVGACCAEQNREAVKGFLSAAGRKICALGADERAEFFAEQAACAAMAPATAAAAPAAPVGGAAAAFRPDSNPGNERIGKDGLEVGRASETPGNASPGEMGGGSNGRSDGPDTGTATADAGAAATADPSGGATAANSAGANGNANANGNGNGGGNGGSKP